MLSTPAFTAQGWQHLARDPAPEGFRLRLAALEDERIEAGFGDDDHVLFSAKGVGFYRPPFIVVKGSEIVRPLVPLEAEHLAHIFSDEPRFAVDVNGAEFELRILVFDDGHGSVAWWRLRAA